jgi:simple sugar transport system substrate-binding protein
MINRRQFTTMTLAGALLAGTARSSHAALGPVDVSKVRADINAAGGKKLSMATVVKVDGIAWFDRMREGVKEFGSLTGNDVWMVGPSHADAAEQVALVENLIAQGVDAICIVPFSVEAVEPVLKKARDRGIIVVAHEASNLQNADYIIEAFDNKAYGAALMKSLAAQMGGEGKYVATVGSLTSQSQNEWIDGGIDYQKANFPKMQLVTQRLETYDDATQDYNKLKEALTAYPDLKGVLGGPMPTSAGAGKLIAERGLKGKLFFAGTGLVSVAGEYLKSGDIAYIQFWDPAVAGIAMNIIAAMAVKGKKGELKAGLDLGLPGYEKLIQPVADRPNLLYGAGWVSVTKDNMAQYNF